MPRQEGLGRGLAALLPHADPEPPAAATGPAVDDPTPGARAMDVLSETLASDLASSESGLALIYKALDALVEHYELDDAAVVLDEGGLGRQVFRAGRKPLGDEDEELLEAGPGLYTQPPLGDDALDRSLVLSLCILALRLDVVRYDAWHDPLTGLYDRRSFDRLLEMAVARSARYGWAFTLVILDLDDFKVVNDDHGHQAGDAVLRDLGDRFRHALRFGDNAARIGGDEFAMILPGTDPDLVPALLDRVRHAAGYGEAPVGFSFGVAQCPEEATDHEELFRLADERLLAAKAAKGTRR